jgi:hypothetical protein
MFSLNLKENHLVDSMGQDSEKIFYLNHFNC